MEKQEEEPKEWTEEGIEEVEMKKNLKNLKV